MADDWRTRLNAVNMNRMGKNPDGSDKLTYTQRQRKLATDQRSVVTEDLRNLRQNTPGAGDAAVTWTPQQFAPQLEGSQATSQVQADPTTQAAQLRALRQLQSASRYGARMGAQEAASMNAARTQAGAQNAANIASVQQASIGRGMRGGGAEAAAMAAGTGTGAVMQAGTQNMIQARQRALQALGQSADLGGTIRQQGMAEKFQRAEDTDAAAMRDQGRQVEAGEYNANVGTQASLYNSQNPFRQAQHELVRAGIESGNAASVRDLTNTLNANQMQSQRDIASGLAYSGAAGGQFLYDQLAEDEGDRKKARY